MRHMAIEMVCAHVGKGREPPLHHSDVLGVSAYSILVMSLKGGLHNFVKTHLLRKSKMRAW